VILRVLCNVKPEGGKIGETGSPDVAEPTHHVGHQSETQDAECRGAFGMHPKGSASLPAAARRR